MAASHSASLPSSRATRSSAFCSLCGLGLGFATGAGAGAATAGADFGTGVLGLSAPGRVRNHAA